MCFIQYQHSNNNYSCWFFLCKLFNKKKVSFCGKDMRQFLTKRGYDCSTDYLEKTPKGQCYFTLEELFYF